MITSLARRFMLALSTLLGVIVASQATAVPTHMDQCELIFASAEVKAAANALGPEAIAARPAVAENRLEVREEFYALRNDPTLINRTTVHQLVNDDGPASYRRSLQHVIELKNRTPLERAAIFSQLTTAIEEASIYGEPWAAWLIQSNDGSMGFMGAGNFVIVFSLDGGIYKGKAPMAFSVANMRHFDYHLLPKIQ